MATATTETPAIATSDGYHLGFVPVYHWIDLTGVPHVHHGKTYRSFAEAKASDDGSKPESWTSYTIEIKRACTHFGNVPERRVRQTIAELVTGIELERAA